MYCGYFDGKYIGEHRDDKKLVKNVSIAIVLLGQPRHLVLCYNGPNKNDKPFVKLNLERGSCTLRLIPTGIFVYLLNHQHLAYALILHFYEFGHDFYFSYIAILFQENYILNRKLNGRVQYKLLSLTLISRLIFFFESTNLNSFNYTDLIKTKVLIIYDITMFLYNLS